MVHKTPSPIVWKWVYGIDSLVMNANSVNPLHKHSKANQLNVDWVVWMKFIISSSPTLVIT